MRGRSVSMKRSSTPPSSLELNLDGHLYERDLACGLAVVVVPLIYGARIHVWRRGSAVYEDWSGW